MGVFRRVIKSEDGKKNEHWYIASLVRCDITFKKRKKQVKNK